jgi:ABC-type multidrug transport system ATPase subunit
MTSSSEPLTLHKDRSPGPGERPALELAGLTRRFGSRAAVDDLSLCVYEGDLYGFLGPNGAGKTTAMRCILGLIRRDAGDVAIFGEPDPVRQRRSVGALVETPRFYEWMTARANLEVACAYAGTSIASPKGASSVYDDVQSALDRVGLSDRADDRVRAYSLGMKQRLGIARAIVGKPRLLLLDEPTNGLDPRGMRDVRDLLLTLCRRDGLTVFLSSHLLAEVEAICNRVGILDHGHLVEEGSMTDLRREFTGSDDVEVGVSDKTRLEQALAGIPEARILGDGESGRVHLRLSGISASTLNKRLVEAEIDVQALVPRTRSLEDLFLQRTRNEIR